MSDSKCFSPATMMRGYGVVGWGEQKSIQMQRYRLLVSARIGKVRSSVHSGALSPQNGGFGTERIRFWLSALML